MKVVNNPEHCADESVTAHERGNVNNVRIDLGGPTLAVVIGMLVIIAGCGLIMGLNLAKQDQMDRDFREMKTQEWLKERRLMDAEAYMIANGIKVPKDDNFGPTGNIQRMKPKEKSK